MRLWSIHPKYLDAKGLVALWREGLLAQKVLANETKGYKNHPQLTRFKKAAKPLGAMAAYLTEVQQEASTRGYNFDATKIHRQTPKSQSKPPPAMEVSHKQLAYEFAHLLAKLKTRANAQYQKLKHTEAITPHPLFKKVRGEIASWEVIGEVTGEITGEVTGEVTGEAPRKATSKATGKANRKSKPNNPVKKTARRTKMPKPTGKKPTPNKPTVGIGILGYRSPKTLAQCLRAMHQRGFFAHATQRVLLAQQTTPKDRQLAKTYGLRLIETPQNCGIMEGMRRIAENLSTDYILNIEEDCILDAKPAYATKQFQNGIRALSQNKADVYRFQGPELRCGIVIPIVKFLRFYAPEPLRLKDTWQRKLRRFLKPSKAIKTIGGAVFCLAEPHKHFPEYITKFCEDNFIVDSTAMTWRNSGVLFSRRWFLDTLIPYALVHPSSRMVNNYQDLEKELNCSWWRTSGFKIGVCPSVFATKRIDYPPHLNRKDR